MKPYLWRTRNTGYVYVDSMTGDDLGGDGTMENPYKTLGKAYRGRSATPGTIVCRGRFCEDMADGNHSTMIRGDYMGAAVFDGEDAFIIYGFGHANMIIENCAPATYDLVVHTGSGLLAGVGRAVNAGGVGYADRCLRGRGLVCNSGQVAIVYGLHRRQYRRFISGSVVSEDERHDQIVVWRKRKCHACDCLRCAD